MTDDAPCPCGSGASFATCCGPVIAGNRPALTAADLMRSRYTAYHRGDIDHLRRSWDPSTVPSGVAFDPEIRWQGLAILDTQAGQALDQEGTVTFVARFVGDAGERELRERSRFVRHEGRWVYIDGDPF
ncbi:MAG: hypothetical protein GY698_20005 [Actinomycetia bacterium]|nr:hypothetical protein [Actinomycetes bacterium]